MSVSDSAEFWQQARELSKLLSTDKKAEATEAINAFVSVNNNNQKIFFGEISTGQFRIVINGENWVDIYPKSNKYHRLRNNTRGRYNDLTQFLNTEIKALK